MASNFYLVSEQRRNHPLVTAINQYLDNPDEVALVAFFRVKSPGEQIMMVGYLLSPTPAINPLTNDYLNIQYDCRKLD